jgi:predicted permease
VLLAWWSRDLLLALRPFGNTTVVLDLPLVARVLRFTVAVTICTALLFGLSPALRATSVDLGAEFQSGGRAVGRAGRSVLRRGLMVVQIALSVVLLISTGLFVRTLNKLQQVDTGFNRRDLVLFRIDATSAGYPSDQFTVLQARLQERLQRLPGARAVTFSSTALLSRVRQNRRIGVRGHLPASGTLPIVNTNGVAVNFFRAMELPLLLGREFTDHDTASSPKVAIVNQAFVRAYFNGENPIGRHLEIPAFGEPVEVVAIAADAKYTDLRGATPPTVYFPSLQQVDGNANFAIRLALGQGEGSLMLAIRSAVREIDPALPVLNLRTQDEQINRLQGQELLFAKLSGLFGGMALLLACVGLYGLMSHAVLRRTREIGLRMALGAPPAHVLRTILGESLTLAVLGTAFGMAGAFGAGRFIAALLFDVSPGDPLTYASAGMALIAIAALATAAPAIRASRIDPATALKAD